MKCQICKKNQVDFTCTECGRKICLLCRGFCGKRCEICAEKDEKKRKKQKFFKLGS